MSAIRMKANGHEYVQGEGWVAPEQPPQYRCGLCKSFIRVGQMYHPTENSMVEYTSNPFKIAYHPRCLKKAGKSLREVQE